MAILVAINSKLCSFYLWSYFSESRTAPSAGKRGRYAVHGAKTLVSSGGVARPPARDLLGSAPPGLSKLTATNMRRAFGP